MKDPVRIYVESNKALEQANYHADKVAYFLRRANKLRHDAEKIIASESAARALRDAAKASHKS